MTPYLHGTPAGGPRPWAARQPHQVEQAFHAIKSMLHLRSIYRDDEKWVRGHLFLYLLAYYVAWHFRHAPRPMRFDDPAPELSPVRPRIRSGWARRRDACRRAAAGTVQFPLPELLRLPTVRGPCEVLRLSGADRLTERVFELFGGPPHLPPPEPPPPHSRLRLPHRGRVA